MACARTFWTEQRRLIQSERTGIGLAELVRRAVDRSYGTTKHATLVQALDDSFGSWADRDCDGAGYVVGLRHGMARRLGDA